MEEVDKIIIDSLKYLQCVFGEDIQSLKQFDADMVLKAISVCLETLNPELDLAKKFPPSMSLRLNIASNIAQLVKDVGFRGDMGYQTILYTNEFEVRRVLMFLIEKLPRDNSHTIQVESTGYVPRIVKNVEQKLKKCFGLMWLPSSILSRGVREYEDGYMAQSFGSSTPLHSETIIIPNYSTTDEALKQYWKLHTPEVTMQCAPENLIPSLLFKDSEFLPVNKLKSFHQKYHVPREIKDVVSREICSFPATNLLQENDHDLDVEIKELKQQRLDAVLCELDQGRDKYASLNDSIKNTQLQLSQLRTIKNDEQSVLKDSLAKVKIKTKSLAIINREENKLKLKNLIENASDRLVELAKQWNEIQTPLLDEYKLIMSSSSSGQLKLQMDQAKLHQLQTTRMQLIRDLKEKTVFEQNLIEKCKKVNKNNNRSAYTRRILEIVGSIRKQNDDIQKVLNETKSVQRDINTLTGQVDRSFTLADELIFHDAKQDEMARRAYKLLAALRDHCGDILKAVTELGQVERESRNLQEQVDTEKNKEIGTKLDRVYNDLQQIKDEIDNLKIHDGVNV